MVLNTWYPKRNNYHFFYQYCLWHSVAKKKHFSCLHHRYIHNHSYESPRLIFEANIQCYTIPRFIRIPPFTSFRQLLCDSHISPKKHFFCRHPCPIPFEKNTQTAATISSHSSSDSTDTSMSSDSSSATSKTSLKWITHLPYEFFLKILIQVAKVLDGFCQYMVRFSWSSAILFYLSIKTSCLVHFFNACMDISSVINIILQFVFHSNAIIAVPCVHQNV